VQGNHPGYDAPIERKMRGIRTELICSYDIPRFFYSTVHGLSPVKRADEIGLLLWYGVGCRRMGRKKRTEMNVDGLVEKWADVLTGLATAHDKDTADRYEAAIEECLTPLLAAPIKQIREFYPKLLKALKSNPQVPFLVWRGYEIWIDQILSKAPDEDVKELKTKLAKEITDMVEQDVKDQIPEALIRALQWRSGETLEEVKAVVIKEKAKGNKVRLRGKESCLFMYAGEGENEVCVQI
jgi:hypothetical protein